MRRACLAALLAAALLAGCGGDKDSGPQTKDDFIADADAVCNELATDIAKAGQTNPKTATDVKNANDLLADAYGELTAEIAKVRLPDGPDRAGAQEFVEAVLATDPLLAQLKSTSKAFVAAVASGDRERITETGTAVRRALGDFRAQKAQSDLLAVSYGLQTCGNLG